MKHFNPLLAHLRLEPLPPAPSPSWPWDFHSLDGQWGHGGSPHRLTLYHPLPMLYRVGTETQPGESGVVPLPGTQLVTEETNTIQKAGAGGSRKRPRNGRRGEKLQKLKKQASHHGPRLTFLLSRRPLTPRVLPYLKEGADPYRQNEAREP
jgi:hypothetical protein